MGSIKLFWHQSKPKGNFGDELSPWIIEKLSGEKIDYVPLLKLSNDKIISFKSILKKLYSKEYKIAEFRNFFEWISIFNKQFIISIGSIISWGKYKNTIVWGAGILTEKDEIYPAKFLAVRGKYTQRRLEELGYEVPSVIGDPALLCNLFFQPPVSKKYRLGMIPHVFHYEETKLSINDEDTLIINLNDDIEKVIEDILSCDVTISTSLHGIIVSHTYGIPSLWVSFLELNKNLNGDNVKFKDYFSSVNIQEYNAPNFSFSELQNTTGFIEKIKKDYPTEMLPHKQVIKEIQKKLIQSAPFKIKEKYRKYNDASES